MTIKQAYRQFLEQNFQGLRIKAPLFFNWGKGLRFDLQVGETDTDQYFQEVVRRATALFEATFQQTDTIYLVLQERTGKRGKIRFSNYCFNQISGLKEEDVAYSKVNRLYDSADNTEIWNVAVVKLTINRVNYKNIIEAISVMDFPPRQPRLDSRGFLTNKQIFFLNVDKKLIYHMYDDRGLDIVAKEKETLLPVYTEFNDWILECNREQIENTFKK
ncbi:DUF3885 domain-containing protein [Nibribacter ruber]|uniref:DUF3885 domain-containing protein n=1 Tax=Nibribacter ruber TaxID=2698458 RepID=A0A6P1NX76_9BACT|nr:DUF3885 domain-containing protein [Nibribacter ruber]QHL86799.1 DUF3885 domain-containing protein [Nibribacter ruber]